MSVKSFKDLARENKAAQKEFEPIPADVYTLRVETAIAGRTANGDKDKFDVRFRVVDGPYANKVVFDNQTISPENATSMSIFFTNMGKLGLGYDFFDQDDVSPEKIAKAMVGAVITGEVEIKEWNGKKNNRVKRYIKGISAGTGLSEESTPERASAPAPARLAPRTAAPAQAERPKSLRPAASEPAAQEEYASAVPVAPFDDDEPPF